MRLIVTQTVEKMAENIWLDFDDIYDYITKNRPYWFLQLNSPLENTVAYKWYIDWVKRIIVFAVTTNWLIYPVYIWDKNDQIARNITNDIVRKNAEIRHKSIERDIFRRKFKIRHF